MRIPSGVTDQVIYFVAVDSTDLKTRETGLSSFTVYRSRNGGTATAMTTPTVTEVDATNMPGVYKLLLDEDMTIDSGDDSQEMCLHITQASMAPVTRVIELYRPKITAGETLTVSSGAVSTVSSVTAFAGTITTLDALDTAQDSQHATTQSAISALNDPTAAAIADAVWDEATSGHVTAGTFGVAVTDTLADTAELQGDWVNGGRLDLILDGILADTAEIGTAGAGLTAIPWNAAWDAEVQSEVNDGLVALGLDHLVAASVTGTDITDNSIIAKLVSSSATADWDTFVNTTDSLQAISDAGGGGGLTALASGTAQSGTASTIVLAASTAFGDDILNGCVINLTGGTGAGQSRVITDYTGATDTATVTPNWITNPSSDTTYEVVQGSVNLTAISNAAEDVVVGSDLPTNFADLAITASTGKVTVGTNDDKTGYSISGTITTLDALDTAQDTQHGTTQSAIAALNDLSAADVNAEVVDALATDTYAESGSVPAATASLKDMIHWVYTISRNKMTATSSTITLRNDGDTGSIATASQSDDGTTYTRAKYA